MKKIDIHVHTRAVKGLTRIGTNSTYATPEELISMYDRIGVEKGVILPSQCPESSIRPQSHEDVMQIMGKHSDRFYWFCNVDPRAGNNSPDTDLSYFINYYKQKGAKGVGEVTANLYFDDPLVLNLFKHAEKCEMPLTFHIAHKKYDCYGLIDDLGLPRLEKVLSMFPKLKFLAHSQTYWAEISSDVNEETRKGYPTGKVIPGRVVELMRKYPNLLGDMSAGSGFNAITRDLEFGYSFLEEFNERLFFGTDICAPENDKQPFFGFSSWLDEACASGKISKTAYENICRNNALRLFGECIS